VLDVTDVGSYPASVSYYGTFDQAGNVYEWVEDAVEDGRGIRGGSWNDYELLLRAWYRDSEQPEFECEFVGFRIAATGSTDLNSAPAVEAGPDQAITSPAAAVLGGSASDDGLPEGALSLAWEKVSGPGEVTFVDSAAESTSASFSTAGTYVLQLTASDGLSSSSDSLTVTVTGSQGVAFRRGNFNQDAAVDISDGVSVLNFLFMGGAAPGCFSAADANDDGKVDISDGIFTLTYLFLGGKSIPDPFSTCGLDPTPDSLTCESFQGCGG
jgi:hypothetical protein